VTSLEPRTPHQPGKLQKLSKNDYGFTLFVFRVNEKCAIVSFDFSMECSWFTGGCSIFGAAFCVTGFCDVRRGAILAERLYTARLSGWESTFWSL
jgi:hypothetical protein